MEDSSDDEIVVLGPVKQARRAANVELSIMKSFKSPQSPQAPSDPPSNVIKIDSTEEDEGDIVQPRRRLKRKAERSSVILSDSDDSEPVVSSPVKRRRRVSPTETPQTPHSSVDKDQQELEDDVKDLQDSGIVIIYARYANMVLSTNMLQLLKTLVPAVGYMSLQEIKS